MHFGDLRSQLRFEMFCIISSIYGEYLERVASGICLVSLRSAWRVCVLELPQRVARVRVALWWRGDREQGQARAQLDEGWYGGDYVTRLEPSETKALKHTCNQQAWSSRAQGSCHGGMSTASQAPKRVLPVQHRVGYAMGQWQGRLVPVQHRVGTCASCMP